MSAEFARLGETAAMRLALVPVFVDKFVRAWPKHDDDRRLEYSPLADALTRRYRSDAHVAAYSVPDVQHRLDRDALARLDAPVPMVFVGFDVDCPKELRVDGCAPDTWWAAERAKLLDLLDEHPGFAYRTRGGYRIVFLTERPIFIRDESDAAAWSELYVAWCRYIERRFAIVPDQKCKEWQRLFRLPHATRDGGPEQLEVIGDASAIGTWHCELAKEDLEMAPALRPVPAPRQAYLRTRDRELVMRRARSYMARVPGAVSGNGGHQQTWDGAINCIRGLDLDEGEAREILYEYNRRCDPPWTERELEHKLADILGAQHVGRGWLLDDDRPAPTTGAQKVPPPAAPPAAATPIAQSPAPTITVPIAEFLGDEAEADVPDEWLVDKLLPAGVVAFLAGLPKSKKTWVAILAAICVASGRALFETFPCKQGSVVIVTEEDTVKQVRQRLWWLARGLDVDPRMLPMRVSAMKGFRIDDADHFARLELEAAGSGLVVLDALTRIHGADENDRTAMQTVTHSLSQIAARTGATVLVIHHMRKRHPLSGDQERAGQRMRGTGDLHALARAILAAEKRDDGATEIVAESNYGEDVTPFAVNLTIEPPPSAGLEPGQKRRATFKFLGSAAEVTERGIDDEVLKALAAQAEPMTTNEVIKSVKGNAGEVRAAIKRLASRKPAAVELVLFDHKEGNRKVEREGWRLLGGAA